MRLPVFAAIVMFLLTLIGVSPAISAVKAHTAEISATLEGSAR